LEGAPSKGPIVAMPVGTNLLPPKRNEKLLGVKTNKKGEVVCGKYTTGERAYFEGGRAHPLKVKFIPQRKLRSPPWPQAKLHGSVASRWQTWRRS